MSPTVKVEPYPQALTFLGQGALLSLSGDRKVGFLVRDVEQVRGRDRPRAAESAAAPRAADVGLRAARALRRPRGPAGRAVRRRRATTATRHRASRPTTASTSASTCRTSRRRAADCSCCTCAGGRAQRAAIRTRTPARRTARRRGDRRRGHAADSRHRSRLHREAREGRQPRRVRAVDSHRPAGDGRARRRSSGSNGLAVLAATTDAAGRAQLAAPPRNAVREKTPQMIIVGDRTTTCRSCRSARAAAISTSRASTPAASRTPSRRSRCRRICFLIAESIGPARRRISGVITRTADWKSSLAGLPIDVEITDPRGLLVSRSS